MKVRRNDLFVQERMMEEASRVRRLWRRGKRFAGRLRHCLMLVAGIPKERVCTVLNVSDPDVDDHASIMMSSRHPR